MKKILATAVIAAPLFALPAFARDYDLVINNGPCQMTQSHKSDGGRHMRTSLWKDSEAVYFLEQL